MLNCILCKKKRHFKSIDIHYTSSPLFTTCILFVTVSLLQTQFYHFKGIGVQNTSSPLFIYSDMACTSFFAVDTFVENRIH
nr:unnamed protein product [Callosobruchus analis]